MSLSRLGGFGALSDEDRDKFNAGLGDNFGASIGAGISGGIAPGGMGMGPAIGGAAGAPAAITTHDGESSVASGAGDVVEKVAAAPVKAASAVNPLSAASQGLASLAKFGGFIHKMVTDAKQRKFENALRSYQASGKGNWWNMSF